MLTIGRPYSGIVAFVLGLAFCLLSSAAVSQAPAGTVLTVAGPVSAESAAGELRSLARRDPVFAGDTILAGANARVRFKLLDDSTYVVQENSSFTIEEFHYAGVEDGTEIADFYFSEGVIEFVSGYIGKQDPSKFRIDTEFAAIGLRGSGGIIRTSSEATEVFVTLGELTARSRVGDELLVLKSGETTIIEQSGETRTEQGNTTGAAQTMTSDGDDVQGAPAEGANEEASDEGQPEDESDNAGESGSEQESEAVTDASLSAAEIYAELLPDAVEPTQEDLQVALGQAIEKNPVLYAELVTVAIDMGLEPPSAAMAATQALGGGNVSEDIITEIFFVATEGLSDTAEVEAAILSADINATPLVANPTQSRQVDVSPGSGNRPPVPSNNGSIPPNSASPAR